MAETHPLSPFSELASVEAWDAWFRWRDRTGLRDTTIEDTWRRVASALAAPEPDAAAAAWELRCMDALESWKLLPDERILADAGTGRPAWTHGPLHAVLNAAAFTPLDGPAARTAMLADMADCAALAVHMLDNAAAVAAIGVPRLRIGIIGIADAIALSGLAYDSDAGRGLAADMARALAEGCLRGNVMLARERGARHAGADVRVPPALQREEAWDVLHDATRHGLRHRPVTAITSQPRLALLANDVADAADPLLGERHAHVIAAPGTTRTIHASGHALNVLRQRADGGGGRRVDTLADLPWTAQLAMRVALQPWLDEPIAYPFLTVTAPDEDQRRQAGAQAAQHGLGIPLWRNPKVPQPAA